MKKKINISSKSIVDLEINVENDFSYDEMFWNNSISKILEEVMLGKEVNLIVEKPRKTSIAYEISNKHYYDKSSKILISKIHLEKNSINQIIEDEDFKLGTLRILISSRNSVNNSFFDYANYPNILEEEVLIYCNGDGKVLTLINSPFSKNRISEILN